MAYEADIIMGAAADTVGITLTQAFFRVFSDKRVRTKLMLELMTEFPGEPEMVEMKFIDLEKLPYLTAVLKESLRLGFPQPGRIPRIVPDSGVHLDRYHIIGGMSVSMSTWIMHRNEDTFPDAVCFDRRDGLDRATRKEKDQRSVSCRSGGD